MLSMSILLSWKFRSRLTYYEKSLLRGLDLVLNVSLVVVPALRRDLPNSRFALAGGNDEFSTSFGSM